MHPPTPTHLAVQHSRSRTTSGALAEAIDGLTKIVLSLPNVLRALVVVVIVATAGFVGYQKFVHGPGPDVRDTFPAAGYVGGIADPTHPGADTRNPQNVEAAHKADEDGTASIWHFNHQAEDNPPEVSIDAAHHVYYRYFKTSDQCVFIRRREGDRDLTQWVRDPSYHKHDVDKESQQAVLELEPRRTASAASGPSFVQTLGGLLAVVSAATNPRTVAAANQSPANCLNPHPGQFRYWWGPPSDQCNSPMFRQFADGCTHYQIYNRCANAWDSRINWTVCVPQHK